ncbi:ATP-dependent nuclease subunit B [Lactococcus nasutitermitis]|uniref:ATP-dependent nuclease subunit B n=1 Tax=Lactococcus nasutitermitis TaxID=1652957 RepID=A0ABV9JBI7_9LACT|nr:ATP-dependent nuclease subunit B [Lactococcus nasutitermitis]
MEILTSEITQDLTAKLLKIAQKELKNQRKIYYIVPSSMSFEKEKEILERLSDGKDTAVFDLLVTRFKQLPYYFDKLEREDERVELSPVGISMLFRKVLKTFNKEQIPLYYSQQNMSGFLEMLVNLRAELLTANLSVEDLPDNPKNKELKLILTEFENQLLNNYANYSEFREFTENVSAGKFDNQLKNSVIIVDGYTRFSAEEELFLASVHDKVARFVVGTYADNQLSDIIYQNSLDMITRFRRKFQAKVLKNDGNAVKNVYSKLTDLVKQDSNFVIPDKKIELTKDDTEHFEIWQAENQTAEIEAVAMKIRQGIARGAKFKDFTVLVGDSSSYEISLKSIFDLYEIPYFYAQEEAMNQHPLIAFFESLYLIKKNNYRTDDVVNLLKTKVYNGVNFNQDTLDAFEYYVQKYKVQGRKNFSTEFLEIENQADVEKLRVELLGDTSPLQKFLTGNNQKTGQAWVNDLEDLIRDGKILEVVNQLYSLAEEENNHVLSSKHEQVWNLLLSTLSEFLSVFANQKLKILDFLDIILVGLKNAKYRQVPANVDVVNVKDYELVEPRTNKFVYAIGLSLTNFPRIKKNSTLLTEEERAEINENTTDDVFIEQLNVVNYNKNLLTVLSLINAASEKLVLSAPQIMANAQDEISPILELFVNHSDESVNKKITSVSLQGSLQYVGNERAMISIMGKIERELVLQEEKKGDKRAFWSSIFRLLAKDNSDFRNLLFNLDKDIEPVNLAVNTVNQIYSNDIYASVSSFERYYNCEYQYFVENTLGLEIFENIDINSKIVGNFFHEVFEKILKVSELTVGNFDDKLTTVLQEVNNEYARYFTRDARSRFTWANLEEIVRQTSVMLKKSVASTEINPLMTESSFGLPRSELGNFVIDKVNLRGRIDRVDQLFDESLGAIDYKSSQHSFKLQSAYDGLSLQFLTYLDVLRKAYPTHELWGALYLHIKNNSVELNSVNQLSDLNQLLNKDMSYEGLILDDKADNLKSKVDMIAVSRNNIYNNVEFENLLEINERHYKNAAERLKNGEITINPVMKRSEGMDKMGNVQGCKYCPLKSICRFEANRHMNKYTREISQKSRNEILQEIRTEVKNG